VIASIEEQATIGRILEHLGSAGESSFLVCTSPWLWRSNHGSVIPWLRLLGSTDRHTAATR
jgi:hypothetical protein